MNWETKEYLYLDETKICDFQLNRQKVENIQNWLVEQYNFRDNFQDENIFKLFVIHVGNFLNRQTNEITTSLENILKILNLLENKISENDFIIMISKLEEIKAIIPNKDQKGYFLNPWIANCFDENKATELASKFPDIDIPKHN